MGIGQRPEQVMHEPHFAHAQPVGIGGQVQRQAQQAHVDADAFGALGGRRPFEKLSDALAQRGQVVAEHGDVVAQVRDFGVVVVIECVVEFVADLAAIGAKSDR